MYTIAGYKNNNIQMLKVLGIWDGSAQIMETYAWRATITTCIIPYYMSQLYVQHTVITGKRREGEKGGIKA